MRIAMLAAASLWIGCSNDAPDAKYWHDTDALRAKVSACLGLNASGTVGFFWPPRVGGFEVDGQMAACIKAADDCDDVIECAGYDPEPCDTDHCDGQTAVRCLTLFSGRVVRESHVCDEDPSGNASCAVVDDVDEGRFAVCHAGACESHHCDGDVKVDCIGGHAIRHDCALTNQICVEAFGEANCVHPTECDRPHCDGNVAILCTGGYTDIAMDCDTVLPGSVCVSEGDHAECVVPQVESSCGGLDRLQWCEGKTALICMSGLRVEVDCGALPTGSCTSEVHRGAPAALCLVEDGLLR